MTAIGTHPTWWKEIGAFAYSPDKHSQYIATFTTKSGHLKIRARRNKGTWHVRWIIFNASGEMVEGNRFFTTLEIETAFDLSRISDASKKDPEKEFECSHIVVGKFIRKDAFLNIPCPGSGIAGDPNISILLTNEIRERVKWILANGYIGV